MPRRLLTTLVLCVWLFGSLPAWADEFFEAVRPLLTGRCLACHDSETRKGGLDLTRRATLLSGGDSGPAFESADPAASLLLEKLEAGQMPPKNPLSPEQVAAFRRWIAAGAVYAVEPLAPARAGLDWWSFQPIARPTPPALSSDWLRTPIDAFVLDRLRAEGLTPNPEADRRTLIRRVTFDLTGLPPTPDDVAAFESDPRPDAYERVVDRLLASPAYGERWARHWLDVVHYADTHGYDKDKRRDHAWPYRDYVIRSLNAGKPYSRFVREQIAGDVLDPSNPDAVVATGFVAAGPWDFVGHVELGEDTIEKRKTRALDRDDMVANTMSTFTSLTVHCARCHDHKFDPIPTRDYYRLQAVFAGVDRGDRLYASPEAAARHAELLARREAAFERLKAVNQRIASLTSPELRDLDAEIASLRDELGRLPEFTGPASPTNGYHSAIHSTPDATAWVQLDLGRSLPIQEIRLFPARPTDFPDTPGFGFPKHFRVEVSDDAEFHRPTLIHRESRPDGLEQGDEPLVLRPEEITARFVRITATRLWKRTGDYVFALAECEVLSDGENVARHAAITAFDTIDAGRWHTRHLVDGFDSRTALPPAADPTAVRRYDLLARIRTLEPHRAAIAAALMPADLRIEAAQARDDFNQAEAALAAQPPIDQVYALLSHQPRTIHVLNRGEVDQPREEATPGALTVLANLDPDFSSTASGPEGARRAALAAWISHPDNPLTWRSIVNRVWQYHFGRGLVDTPNDFGRNGSQPTHPELLDWLAVELRDGDQSLKSLHRLIVTSAVYRQSSAHNEQAAAVDAENRWLWRQNRRRLEAEEIRDAMLAVSGLLRRTMYGPGFEVFRFKDDHSPTYDHEDREASLRPTGHRRAVYRFIVRSVPNPWIECLDGADPNTSVPTRNTTLTALQALTLLNDAFTLQQAEAMAASLGPDSVPLQERIERAVMRALGRRPTSTEHAALTQYAETHGLPAACRILFNLNEFLFVD
ncbi:MAG: cytochrome c [Isosphaeraceae bacterium]|jgi:mono/diheme cytochrome c family protein|nr:MAG: cytochrome c [Isosphaeraceae bacterium]